MKLGATAKPRRVLTDLAGSGATGALHVGGASPGVLHLADGQVVHAASAKVPGVGDLLTLSGRLPASVWQAAVEEGIADNRVGELLVARGHLTAGELQLCVLGVVHDAAFFVLGADEVAVRFERDRPHWLGPVTTVDARALVAEVERKNRLLTEAFDEPALDAAAVTPVLRLGRDRVRLTGLQWELIVAADGVATPADLARRLGRAGYACLLEVRRLAAERLVRLPGAPSGSPGAPTRPPVPPQSAPPEAERMTAVEALLAAGTVPIVPAAPPPPPMPPPPMPPPSSPPPSSPPPADATVELPHAGEPPAPSRGFRLPRRKPVKVRPDGAEPADQPDEALLHRLRTALKGLS